MALGYTVGVRLSNRKSMQWDDVDRVDYVATLPLEERRNIGGVTATVMVWLSDNTDAGQLLKRPENITVEECGIVVIAGQKWLEGAERLLGDGLVNDGSGYSMVRVPS